MGAAVETASNLDPMSDDPALAMLADRRDCLDCALKAVEGMSRSGRDQLKRFIVIVATNFTCRHKSSSVPAAPNYNRHLLTTPLLDVRQSRDVVEEYHPQAVVAEGVRTSFCTLRVTSLLNPGFPFVSLRFLEPA